MGVLHSCPEVGRRTPCEGHLGRSGGVWQRTPGNSQLSTADELDNFETVARPHLRLRPASAGENVAITLDRNPIGPHADSLEEQGDAKAVGNFVGIAVNCDGHFTVLRASRAGREADSSQRLYFAIVSFLKNRHDSFYSRGDGRGFERMTYRNSSLPWPALAWITSAKPPLPSFGIGKRIWTRPFSSVVPR